MTMPEDEEQTISVPVEDTPPESVEVEEVPEEVKPKDELSDLFEVPQPEDNDMAIDHLLESDGEEEDDLSDLVEVSNEDLLGNESASSKKRYKLTPKARRIVRIVPPTSLGGMQ